MTRSHENQLQRAPMADSYMSFLGEAMVSPSIARGIIDDLFAGFDEEDGAEERGEGGENEEADDDAEE
ncbi:hypothetical protein HAX54_048945 [Datura stramonium]|uniref:Uncharacterized protein n=1 Tax=Datura stramonium TaxID=4076 RepID=A0ABS8SUB0_DATST|nr:hypothetical protein [Datura stramonium]